MTQQTQGQQEKTPFNWTPIIVVVSSIVLLVAFIAAVSQWGIENVVRWVATLIVVPVFFYATRGITKWFWKDFSFWKVKIILAGLTFFTAVWGIIELGKKAMQMISTDTSPVSPTIIFSLSVVLAFIGKKWTKLPGDENTLSFRWVVLTNAGYLLFASMFDRVLPHYIGGFSLSFISTLLLYFLTKRAWRRGLITNLKAKVYVYPLMSGVGAIAGVLFLLSLASRYDIATNWLKIYATISGSGISAWVTFILLINKEIKKALKYV